LILLGVQRVVREIVAGVAVGAALLGRHPLGHREHDSRELRDVQIRQDLHVLVDVLRERRIAFGRRLRCRHLIDRLQFRHGARVVHVAHLHAAIADLLRGDRRSLAAGEQQRRRHHHRQEKRRRDDTG
jgi:hypothetical protein